MQVASRDRVTPPAARPGPIATDEEFAALLGGPLPTPPGPRPFSRTTTLAELRAVPLGRLALWGLNALVDRTLPPEDREATDGIRQAFLDGMPLRALVSLSGGRVSLRAVDRFIAVLNASPLRRWGR